MAQPSHPEPKKFSHDLRQNEVASEEYLVTYYSFLEFGGGGGEYEVRL